VDLQLNNQIALITGSSKGIGFGIAKEFIAEGAVTVLTGRNTNDLNAAIATLSKNYEDDLLNQVNGDLNDDKVLKKLFDKISNDYGRLDHLVCNIGSGKSVPPLQEDEAEFIRMLNINLLNSVKVITKLLPLIKNSILDGINSTSITFISSICGIETLGCPTAYASSKSALISYAKNLSFSLGKKGIRVNVVSPGNIMFSGSTWEKKLSENPNKVNLMLKNEVPLECFGEVDDIASMVVFLASNRAKFINGANFVVDGGQTRG